MPTFMKMTRKKNRWVSSHYRSGDLRNTVEYEVLRSVTEELGSLRISLWWCCVNGIRDLKCIQHWGTNSVSKLDRNCRPSYSELQHFVGTADGSSTPKYEHNDENCLLTETVGLPFRRFSFFFISFRRTRIWVKKTVDLNIFGCVLSGIV